MGDDLTVTNIKRIKRAADEGACNALLLKVCVLLHNPESTQREQNSDPCTYPMT